MFNSSPLLSCVTLFVLMVLSHAAASSSWSICNPSLSYEYTWHIQSLTFQNPIKSTNVTVNLGGNLTVPVESAPVAWTVFFDDVMLLNNTGEMCDWGSNCPLQPGAAVQQSVLMQVPVMPWVGNIAVKLDVLYNTSAGAMFPLFCVWINGTNYVHK
eukprot:PhF_6_TR1512/c0_g1_i1/m.2755